MPAGDRIKLSAPERGGFWEIAVLFEDADLLVLDKPADLPATGQREAPEAPTLAGLLHAGVRAGKPWSQVRQRGYLAPAHRPDPESSGLFVLAKNRLALAHLAAQFGTPRPQRRHLVLVHGTPMEDEFEVNVPLAPDERNPGRFRLDPRRGKKSLTRFAVVERFRAFTLLHACPHTERPGQIRLHLAARRLRVVGDAWHHGGPLRLSTLKRRYEPKPGTEEKPLIGRPAIHAEQFLLQHPATGAPLTLAAPLPKDFAVGLKYLRRYAA